ncbi:unnamed protein product [Thelazia callipaeda]|uniref:Serine protease K12H4.7 n=1 Tax=Thelazia callipaeda TaxID=103827 RepID=A0A0N5CY81_THECL|nr:unnamed protein product [Thelazia callipaeda]
MLQQALIIIIITRFYQWRVEASQRLLNDKDKTALTSLSFNKLSIFKTSGDAKFRPSPPEIGRSSFKQKLDHFNTKNGQTWRQYYMHRKSPYQNPDGPVFLMIGGEDQADRAWLTNYNLPYLQLADQINASTYMLEHRFYGASRPTKNTSLQNLKYLNAKQAIEDIHHFVQEINQREGLSNPKWIAFGGSYSGSLAAWIRQKYPQDIRASVASSAPLQAKLNFQEFEEQIKKIIEKKDEKCVAVIQKLFQKMREMSETNEGRKDLVRIFRLDKSLNQPSVSQKDIANFFLVITNYISFIIMHSGINVKGHRDLLTLDTMCKKLTNSPLLESIRGLISMVMISQGKLPQSALDIGYKSFVDFMRDERWNTASSQPRAWLYQNCNEFGHFRTSEKPDGLFGGTLPLKYDLQTFCIYKYIYILIILKFSLIYIYE